MKTIAVVLAAALLVVVAWFFFMQPQPATPITVEPPLFRCDGRTQCEEMTSCEEAMFFLKSCPRTADLDKDTDGIPCEVQWCQR